MAGKGLLVVVVVFSLDERFVMLALSREPRAQRKDWPESVGEDHLGCVYKESAGRDENGVL